MSKDILTAGQCSSNKSNKSGKRGNNEQFGIEEKKRSQSKTNSKLDENRKLGFLVAQKMIWKFLSINRIEIKEVRVPKYTKEELATKLGITIEELDKYRRNYFHKNIASRIHLLLVKLYCSTKWIED